MLSDRYAEQMLTSKVVAGFVVRELARIHDPVVAARIRELLVAPYPVDRSWDYGTQDESVTCWTVLEHSASNTGIAYAEAGFGPANPWGLVFLEGDHMGVGMDSGRYCTLESAFRESMAWDGPNPVDYEIP